MTRADAYPSKTALALFGLGFIALFLALPFPPGSITLLLAAIVLAGVVASGLLLQEANGLPEPLLKWQEPSRIPRHPAMQGLAFAALIGTGLGIVMLAVIRFLLAPALPQFQVRFAAEGRLPIWQRSLIAFDSAVLEELLFRLLLLSLLAWLLSRRWKSPAGRTTMKSLWLANVLVALGFGMMHLPQWAAVTRLTPALSLIVVLLNSVGAITFGCLFFTRGIGAAMVAHLAADVILHVIGLTH
jgi:hypothetical protein